MKADFFFDRVHGHYSQLLERKIVLGLLSKSPQEIRWKRAYGCLVFIPLKAVSGFLLTLVHLVETIATAAIHLVGVACGSNSQRELLRAKRYILVGLPGALILCALRAILAPFYLIKMEVSCSRHPHKFEADVRTRYSYQEGIRELELWKLSATKEMTKRRIQKEIDSLKNEIPVFLLENFLLFLEVQKEKRAQLRESRPQYAGDNA